MPASSSRRHCSSTSAPPYPFPASASASSLALSMPIVRPFTCSARSRCSSPSVLRAMSRIDANMAMLWHLTSLSHTAIARSSSCRKLIWKGLPPVSQILRA